MAKPELKLRFVQQLTFICILITGTQTFADADEDFLAAAEPLLFGDPESAFEQLERLAEAKNLRASIFMSRVQRRIISLQILRKAVHSRQ